MTTRGRGRMTARLIVSAVVSIMAAAPGWAQLKVESADGSSSVKFGFLVQGWAESFDQADGGDAVKDMYFRRLRLLAGGKITDKLSFFFETDSPGIGKGQPDGTKKTSDIYIQDFVVSYKFAEGFTLDGGLILIPTCYNCTQSAATLAPVDYGAYSFLSSGPTTANVGRDYGLQARGYLADDHLEYRLGLYQGVRGDGTNNFRYAGRVMWNFWDRHKGLYYTGTSLGKKKLFSIGASYDAQEEYSTYAFDAFFDHPIGQSNSVTLQADLIHYDGDTFLTALPETDAMLFEASYYFGDIKLAPFFQYVDRDFADAATPDQSTWQGGLAYYPLGYKLSIKLGLGEVKTDGADSRFRGILQCQVFMF